MRSRGVAVATLALTAACVLVTGGPVSPAAADPPEPGPIATFHYTGGPQLFTVPEDVTFLTFDVIGGRGGYPEEGGDPGPGGETIAGLDVTPGQKLTIWVGANAGRDGGWGYTCGGEGGTGGGVGVPGPGELAFDGGGGGGSSAVTAGVWSEGEGSCSVSTRPAGWPLIVGGGGGGGGGREHVPLTNYQGGIGGAGGNPAQAGFDGQGSGRSPGGCVRCAGGANGGPGATEAENNTDTMGGGGGGGGGYVPSGGGGGGGGQLPSGDGVQFGGAGGAGGTSFTAESASRPIFVAGPLDGSGIVTVSAVRQEGFGCTHSVEHPSFPEGVQFAHVSAEGAAGGNRSGETQVTPGKGGHGGIASADLEGFVWSDLNVIVGCAGSDGSDGGGGYGFGRGGSKGIANSHFGDDGAGGGGGSGVEIGEFPLAVAGGGGGGGGGAETIGTGVAGGNGGNGGAAGQSGTHGHDGGSEAGGDGGCAGSEFDHQGIDGGEGEGSSSYSGGGGGGGGGGGWVGACGGEGGNFPSGGGGGGGGGGSWVLEHSAAVTDPQFSTSEGIDNNGSVVFSYVVSIPSHVALAGGSGQQAQIGATFAKPLEAQVLDQLGRPLIGIPVTFTIPSVAPNAPSGQFAGGATTATASSDVTGIATSPAVIADEQVGSWQVQASVAGAVPADFSLTNTARPTATALKASANPALAGEEVAFTATVEGTSGGPTPSGSVQFTSDGSALGAPVPLSGGSAQATAELTAGSHAIEAVFEPGDGFETSKAKLTEKVEKATSAITLASSSNPSGFGEAVTFTAHVDHAGSREATGEVQFEVDGTPLGAPVPLSSGTAVSPASGSLSVASHEVLARYAGDEFVSGSEGKLTQSVGPDATGTELQSDANPSVFGQAVTFTATVRARSGDTPTGAIRFLIAGNEVCEGTLSGGLASCSPPAPLGPGSHDVIAEYAGDTDFAPSHGTLTETVARAPTLTSISASVAAPRFGQPVTFTAEVAVPAPGGGIPTGELQFTLDGEPLGAPVTITGGAATTPPISTMPVGMNAVGVEYSGDSDHLGSAATLFEEVLPGGTTTTLTSSANPTHFGVPVTFAALVEASAPAAGVPAGTVRFRLDGKAICDVPLSAAEAICEAPTLYAGDHVVVASYSGEANFEASDGKLTESVVRVPSQTIASTSESPALVAEPVTLSADVVGGLAGEAPTGTVSFRSGSQLLGTVPVLPTEPGAGRASLRTSSLVAGDHEIVATYSGDDAIEPSSAPPFEQAIDERAALGPAGGDGPVACAPPNVRARALVFRGRDQIRLVARNRGAAPARVTLRLTDEHGRGSTLLGKLTREVPVEGMVRVVRHLGATEMERLRRARGGFTAEVTIAPAFGSCASQSSRPLTVRRLVTGQRVWFQRNSIRRALPRNTS